MAVCLCLKLYICFVTKLMRFKMAVSILGKCLKSRFLFVKQTKHGSTCLVLCLKPYKIDLSVCVDVALNPGPDFREFNQTGNEWRPCCHKRQSRSTDSSLDTKTNNYYLGAAYMSLVCPASPFKRGARFPFTLHATGLARLGGISLDSNGAPGQPGLNLSM